MRKADTALAFFTVVAIRQIFPPEIKAVKIKNICGMGLKNLTKFS
jgi:hypothetical protein